MYHYNTGAPQCVQQDLFNQYIEPMSSIDPMNGQIEIYWGLIGLVAGMLGTTIEALAAVVLIHEIAHAYTHMGADIDGVRWESLWFSKSDSPLKEGLAQYYTHYITERIDTQVEGAHNAYLELLSRQPERYKAHMPWVENSKPEEVRLAMIEIRRNGPAKIKEFNDLIEKAKLRLRKE